MKKVKRISLMFTVFLALLLSLIPAEVLVQGEAPSELATGNEDTPASAQFLKILKTPTGTTLPGGTFTINFAPQDVENMPEGTKAPSIFTDNKVEITVPSNDTDNLSTNVPVDAANSGKTPSEGTDTYTLAIKIPTDKWTAAGTYTYTVSEAGNGIADNSHSNEQTATYDKSEYSLSVYVFNKSEGPGVYVKYIEVKKTKDESGSTITEPQKVNVNPGENNGFVFNNSYIEKIKVTDPAGANDKALSISKTVTGDMGDHEAYFSFNTTVTKPALITGENISYTAYILDENSQKITDLTANSITGATTDAEGKITVTSDQVFSYKLKHGQKLYFEDLHAGATYTASETEPLGHTSSYTQTVGGTASGPSENAPAEATIKNAGNNKLEVQNKKDAITPTGLFIDNLPYFIMALLALLIIVGYSYLKYKFHQGPAKR